MGVITMLFSGLVVRWYSWISEQVMAKENNTWSFSSVVSGWTKVTKERHFRACFAMALPCDGACSCVGVASQNFTGIIFTVWLVPSKTAKFNHPRKFVPIRYVRTSSVCEQACELDSSKLSAISNWQCSED